MKNVITSLVMLTLISLHGATYAEQDNIEYIDILGIQVKFNDDNSFESLRSTAEQEFIFSDRSSIRQAVAIATMAAKGELSKWMEETITSSEGLDEVSTQIANRQTDGNGQTLDSTKEDIQTYLRNLSNSSRSILTGVTVIEQKIYRDKKYASVTIGVSTKYMQAAAKMRTETAKNIAKGRDAEANMNNAKVFNRNPVNSNKSSFEPVEDDNTYRRSPAFSDF